MQVTETLNEGLKRKLQITVDAGEIDNRLNDYFEDLKKRVRLKGFRPGMVPRQHLERLYRQQAMNEILSNLINETSRSTLETRSERAALDPQVELDDGVREKLASGSSDLSFSIDYEILPDFDLPDFSAISLTRHNAEIGADTITERIKLIAESQQEYNEKDGSAADKDRVTLSFDGKIDGESFEGGSTEEIKVAVGSGQLIPDFERQLIGLSKGDKAALNVAFPSDYPAEHLKGKEAVFDVDIKNVESPVPVDISDKFAEGLGFKDLEDLNIFVKGRVETEYSERSSQKLYQQLLDQLDERCEFALPQGLVDIELNNLKNQLSRESQQAGVSAEALEEKIKEAQPDMIKSARRRVRLGLMLSHIGEENKITVSEEELQQALQQQMRNFAGQEQALMDYYKKNPQAVEQLRAPIYERKVSEFILELVNVSDKTVSETELFATDDNAAPESKGGEKKSKKSESKQGKKKKTEEKSGKVPKAKA